MKPFSASRTFRRKATVTWLGLHPHGKGAMSTQSAVLKKTPYLSGIHTDGAKSTSPPELIAAAHAGSFSMALADELGVAGHRPNQIDTTATVTMENVAAGWTMTQIHLDVIATAPNIPQCDFIDAALRAKSNCPISRLVHATISMSAKLKRLRVTPGISRALLKASSPKSQAPVKYQKKENHAKPQRH